MMKVSIGITVVFAFLLTTENGLCADEIVVADRPSRLEVRSAGEHSVRVTLMPRSEERTFPINSALPERDYAAPAIKIQEISAPVKSRVGSLNVEVRPSPLSVIVSTTADEPLQKITFEDDGSLTFRKTSEPILGLGEGGPLPKRNSDWRKQAV